MEFFKNNADRLEKLIRQNEELIKQNKRLIEQNDKVNKILFLLSENNILISKMINNGFYSINKKLSIVYARILVEGGDIIEGTEHNNK